MLATVIKSQEENPFFKDSLNAAHRINYIFKEDWLSPELDHPYVETLNDLIRYFERPYKEFDQCRNEKPAQAP